jgi:hypothetical protein
MKLQAYWRLAMRSQRQVLRQPLEQPQGRPLF